MISNEEELQNRVEGGITGESSSDSRGYELVFNALRKEPKLTITNAFAESIVKKIVVRKKREARRDHIWLSFGIIFLTIGLVVTAVVAGLQFQLGFLKSMSGYLGVFAFGCAAIFVFNWLERKTLSKHFTSEK